MQERDASDELSGAGEESRGTPTAPPSTRPRPRWPLWLAIAGLAAVLALLVGTGLRGLDFGTHWDEDHHVVNAAQTIRTGVLLPLKYDYPSVSFWLCMASLAPDWSQLRQSYLDGRPLQDAGFLAGFRMRTRKIFLCVAALTVIWTFLLVWRWRGRALEAFFAAAFLGTSWECAYHLRWVAPDAVTMQFTALCLLFCVCSRRGPRGDRWLVPAALAAGLACGTKYPGGITLLLVLLAAWQCGRRLGRSWKTRGVHLFQLSVIFAVTYLVSTPGTLLEWDRFQEDVRYVMGVYSSGHPGHATEPGLEHLQRIGTWLLTAFSSPYPVLAMVIAALAIMGLMSAFWRDPGAALLLTLVPGVFLVYMTSQRVLTVRNYLLFVPVVAIFAARGVGEISQRLTQRSWRGLFVGALVAVITINGLWLVSSAESIVGRGAKKTLEMAVSEAQGAYVATPALRAACQEHGVPLPEGLKLRPEGPRDRVLALASEGNESRPSWPANTPGTFRWFGPRMVNPTWYPGWITGGHVYLAEWAVLLEAGIDPWQ